MGSFTTNFKLYKPASTEFVDVDRDLNNNWQITDKAVKQLMEYEYTSLPVPETTTAYGRARFYKSYSNSVMAYFRANNVFYQDPTAFVSTWIDATSILNTGDWQPFPDYPPAYRIIKKTSGTTTEVEWSGAIWANGTVIDVNTNLVGLFVLPSSITPVVSKYFTVFAGNATTNFSVGRLGFFSDNDVEFKRYGVTPSSSDGNRIDLGGIKYNLEAAA